eukprot:CAMPEP_0119057204 /NCGR_PEP_ID=MMETSP1178-20130426/1721_1 /TAXON_ID=33656 /ORGANISM="unid sp, Strain CCMP2000" /LENGTH=154 /DNA_ID=CAMNT_0007038015 /DNA_START=134 /DNA_END=594 /DNA_ORIENTATION=+
MQDARSTGKITALDASSEPLSGFFGQDSGELLVHLPHFLSDHFLVLAAEDMVSPDALLSPGGHRNYLLFLTHLSLAVAAPAVLKWSILRRKRRQDGLPPPHSTMVQAGRWSISLASTTDSSGRKGLHPAELRMRESYVHASPSPGCQHRFAASP